MPRPQICRCYLPVNGSWFACNLPFWVVRAAARRLWLQRPLFCMRELCRREAHQLRALRTLGTCFISRTWPSASAHKIFPPRTGLCERPLRSQLSDPLRAGSVPCTATDLSINAQVNINAAGANPSIKSVLLVKYRACRERSLRLSRHVPVSKKSNESHADGHQLHDGALH